MAHLLIIEGPDVDRRIELVGHSNVVFGRSPRCSIVLRDREVSRKHAEISFSEDGYSIRDLGSSNGTFVNGVQASTNRLIDRDRIQIGRNLIVFVAPQSNEAVASGPTSDPTSSNASNYAIEIIGSSEQDASSHGSPSQIRQVLDVRSPAFDYSRDNQLHASSELDSSSTSTETEHSDAYWQMMYRAVIQISRTSDSSELVQQILEMIFQWIKCDRACILLSDPISKTLSPAGRRDRNRTARSSAMQISHTILEYVQNTGEAVLTGDAISDERWSTSASITQAGVREAICVPMPGRHGLVGVIYIDTSASAGQVSSSEKVELLNLEHLKLLTAIGHHAALVFEDAYNYRMMLRSERLVAMGTVVASISHHIKNILQGVEGGSFLVNSAIQNGDMTAVTQGWNIVEKSQRRIKSLVLDMLAYGKDRQPQQAEHDLNKIVGEAVDLMKATAKDQNIFLEFHPTSPAIIYAEADGIYHAVVNLLTNAMDACVEKRKTGQTEDYQPLVNVQVRMGRSQVETVVTDNGAGMDRQQMEKAFIAFESTKGAGGSGLGLAVSRKIINEHGGNITVSSQLGSGSQFIIQLPTDSDQEAPRNDQTITLP